MALPATDTFTGTNNQNLTTYSANWTYNVLVGTALQIFSNALRPNLTDDSVAHWNADTFNADQYAKGTLVAIEAAFMGCAVRCASGATQTAYYTVISSGTSWLNKYVAGTATNIANFGLGEYVVNDIHQLEAEGTILRSKRNGVLDSIGAQTDSSISSGFAGIAGAGNATLTRMDNWEGGNLGGAPAVFPLPDYINQLLQNPVYRM